MELKVLQVDRTQRPSSSWAKVLDEKRKSFLQITDDSGRAALRDGWADRFVTSEIQLEGQSPVLHGGAHAIRKAIADVIALCDVTTSGSPVLEEFVTGLYRALSPASSASSPYRFRAGIPLFNGHEPAPASIVPDLFARAIEWTAEPSFLELHPVEQAVLMHSRISDLQPFESMNPTIARLVASYLTLRHDYPPLIFLAGDRERYAEALGRALLMQTQPCVELFAEAMVRTIESALENER